MSRPRVAALSARVRAPPACVGVAFIGFVGTGLVGTALAGPPLGRAASGAEAPGSSAATPADAAALDQVLQLLAQRRHGHVTFTEVHQLAMLDHPLESSGELLYDAPDRLEKRTLAPRPEDLLLEHGVLTAQRGNRRRVLSLRD